MIIINDEINSIKQILPEEGYLLTDGEIVTDALFMNIDAPLEGWYEIIIPNFIDEE